MDYNLLFDREPIKIDLKQTLKYIKGKRVLITGAGGSIGSEISKQMLYGGAERLFILGHGENSIFKINKILQSYKSNETKAIVPIVGEIQDRGYIFYLLKSLKADVLFHTAAHKHVSLGEHNPVEVIKNNVFGTKNLIDASKKHLKEKFIMISTDKAVEPVSVYGASKLLAEELVLREMKSHKFLIVRFGNVIGTNGSVLPIIYEQILKDEPITITHPEVKRFFMTIKEAVSLVLKIGNIGKGGELYILDMGEQIKIKHIVEKMISMLHPEQYKIIYTGLEYGEKMEEKLWADNEEIIETKYAGILMLKKKNIIKNMDDILSSLYKICFCSDNYSRLYRNRKMLRGLLHEVFPTVQPRPREPEY